MGFHHGLTVSPWGKQQEESGLIGARCGYKALDNPHSISAKYEEALLSVGLKTIPCDSRFLLLGSGKRHCGLYLDSARIKFYEGIKDTWNVLSGVWLLVSWNFFPMVIKQVDVSSALERGDISFFSQTWYRGPVLGTAQFLSVGFFSTSAFLTCCCPVHCSIIQGLYPLDVSSFPSPPPTPGSSPLPYHTVVATDNFQTWPNVPQEENPLWLRTTALVPLSGLDLTITPIFFPLLISIPRTPVLSLNFFPETQFQSYLLQLTVF